MRLVLHREIPDDVTLAGQWNELVRQMECPEIFYTYEWAFAVSHAYRSSVMPLLLLAYERDSLIGVAALAIDERRRETFFLANTTADYCDFVSAPAHRSEFAELVLEELRNLKIPALLAASLPADSATPDALIAATHAHGYRIFSRPAYLCARITLGSGAERRSLMNVIRNRKVLRYCLKGLAKHGPVSVEHLKSGENLQAALPEFMRAHIARFSAAGRQSNLIYPQRQYFLAELARLLCAQGGIVLSRLRVGDHPVAWNYGFQFCGSWFYYQPTFDNEWRQFSPGLCLLSKIVEASCDNPEIERLDMGLGDEGYKKRFATGSRQTLDVTVTASTARYVKDAVRYHVAAAIKSSPGLEHGVRRVLGRVPAGGGHA